MRQFRVVDLIITSFKLCVLEIWTNRTRSLITSFGIFLGVVSFLVNVSFIKGLNKDINESMEQIGGLNVITIKKKIPDSESESISFNNSNGIKLVEIEEIASSSSYIRSVLPQIEMPWGPVSASGKSMYAKPFAISENHFRAYNYEIAEGRSFSREDHIKKNSVCIIGLRIVKRLFPDEGSPVGKTITLNKHRFTIIGIIKTDDEFSWRASQVLFPYSLYTYRFGGANASLDEIAVELTNSSYAEKSQSDFTRLLKQKHRGIEDFEIEMNSTKIKEMRTASMGIEILLVSIATITLLMGGISIMNIMFAAIGDRVREIGIRKALGARRSDVFLQFIIEAVMLCFVGGIPAMILCSFINIIPKGFFPYDPTLASTDYFMAIGFTFLAGIASGVFPALRAANMEPVEALRY